MDIVDIVDSSVDESLQYYRSKACEKRVTDEALHDILTEIISEAVVEIGEVYISTKCVNATFIIVSPSSCQRPFSFCDLCCRYVCRPRPVQFNPLLEVIELLTNEVVENVANEVGKTVRCRL